MAEYLALSNTMQNSTELVVLLQEIGRKLDVNNQLLQQINKKLDDEERSY